MRHPILSISAAAFPILLLTCATVWGDDAISGSPGEDSRGWFLLSQTDTDGLLVGLRERLAAATSPAKRETSVLAETNAGITANIRVEVDTGEEGEVIVGFFENAQWWVSEPSQVRRFPGPGQYAIDNLQPGKYYVGALLISNSKKIVLGVEEEWPSPTVLAKGKSLQLRLKLSSGFRNRPFGVTHFCEQGFMGEWGDLDRKHLVTVQTVDTNGEPIPFCRVTIVERRRDNPDKVHWYHDVGTDAQGYAYLDKVEGRLSVSSQRFDFLPQEFAARYQHKRDDTIYDAKDRPSIKFAFDDYPTGNGSVSGRVHDQNGNPLTTYYVSITRWATGGPRSDGKALSHGMRFPVVHEDGRFSINDLPVGRYSIGVRHFDYVTHVRPDNALQFDIADDLLHPSIDIEVEAKQLFYAMVVDQDVRPILSGAWRVKDVGSYAFTEGIVRVALSRAEIARLTNSGGRVLVRARGGNETEVALEELSTDPARPSLVVIDVAEGNAR